MKKVRVITALGVCFVLCSGCCSGLLYLGWSLNSQDARRDYDAAGQLWSAGKKAEAAEKYKTIKRDYLGKDEQAVAEQRLHEFAVEKARGDKDAGDQEWAAGKKDEAAARYRAIALDLLDAADRETVEQRIEEVDRATARKDLEEGNKLWADEDKTAAAGKYDGIPVDLLDPADRKLVTERLDEAANQQWDDDRKGEAAARYKRLHKDLLAEAERASVEQRIRESDAEEKKYANAATTGNGKKVQLNAPVELYYTAAITPAEARRLGDYLEKAYKDVDHKISAQITKEGKTYQYRVVVKKGLDRDDDAVQGLKAEALRLSLFVFDGADVEIHMCDEQLKTLRVVIPLNKP